MKHAQSSFEFVIITGVVLFFVISFIVALYVSKMDKLDEDINIALEDQALIVQDELNLAHQARDGYLRTFTLPQTVKGREYDIDVVEGAVYAKTLDEKHALAVPAVNITGNVQIGSNTVRKANGIIYVNA